MSHYNIPIVYYHSVGPKKPDWRLNFLTLDLRYFEDQLKYFSTKHNVISLTDYIEITKGRKNSPANPLVITFDDGYLDNWIWAFPLLRKYGLKATIFVSPEYVDPRNIVRPNLDDFNTGNASAADVHQWGFLSWDEMRVMENSGLIQIESHTMTHTKYVVSDKITGFNHPKADSIYTILNKYPNQKPFYINDPKFENQLPFGYPLFEMKSSVNAIMVQINPSFYEEALLAFNDYDFASYDYNTARTKVDDIYNRYVKSNILIIASESDSEYVARMRYEVEQSKEIIEQQLNKKVAVLCWPHGDNNAVVHKMAIDFGYEATMWGKETPIGYDPQRIPSRIGTSAFRNNRLLTLQRAAFKINCAAQRFPFFQINNIYQKIRY